MAKLAQATSKYTIVARFTASGVIDKPDVIGAVFGQTEGLLGADMDLRELQRTGRIGRIEVSLKSEGGKSEGMIEIPSSLDASETALIAATLETIERIGPCETKITVDKVEDVRSNKRKYLVERAKDLLSQLEDKMPERTEMMEEVVGAVRTSEVMSYKGLPCGPDLEVSEEIVVCEGRADVLKLLRNGIKNTIAVEGTSVPDAVVELSKRKSVTAFLDGDRGGDLILREMVQKGVELEFVARAPYGKEVEELTKKEIYKSLRERVTIETARRDLEKPFEDRTRGNYTEEKTPLRAEREPESKEESAEEEAQRPKRRPAGMTEENVARLKDVLDGLTGTRAAYLLDARLDVLGKIPTKEVFNAMREVDGTHTVVLDGTVDQKLINFAKAQNVRNVIGMKLEKRVRIPRTMNVMTARDLA